MDAFWIQFGFMVFVLAPVWSIGLGFLVEKLIINRWPELNRMFTTLMFLIAFQTFCFDILFFVSGLEEIDKFILLWQFFWAGLGLWWWVWSIVGYAVATVWEMFDNSGGIEYLKKVFKSIVGVALVSLLIMFFA